jgi:hypothetical protein
VVAVYRVVKTSEPRSTGRTTVGSIAIDSSEEANVTRKPVRQHLVNRQWGGQTSRVMERPLRKAGLHDYRLLGKACSWVIDRGGRVYVRLSPAGIRKIQLF